MAELAAARAAAPDGRVCGSFGQKQVAPLLTRRLRWFVVALVLVVAQGLTAREALAQVRKPVRHAVPAKKRPARPPAEQVELEYGLTTSGIVMEEAPPSASDTATIRTYAEVMPTLPGRDYPQTVAYIQQQARWPANAVAAEAEGRVFVGFTVGKDGAVRDAQVLKGIHPLCDAEALRVVRGLTTFAPGRQNGKPVPVRMTVPVTFRRQ